MRSFLVPARTTRVANSAPGSGLIALGLLLDIESSLAVAALVALGVALAVRGFRLAVVLDGEHLLVRGFLRSRRIDRATVESSALSRSNPVLLRWRDRRGRRRWTPLWAISTPAGTLFFAAATAEENAAVLRQWLRARR